ncbi:hypothetical protein SDC9_185661 [bioreactor metagenome]|uniref:Uncharacterized protein n=1 Tax=bioreactor metagenome TaxID=1076179 RepID=A0A645HGQ6_9ZZZZ
MQGQAVDRGVQVSGAGFELGGCGLAQCVALLQGGAQIVEAAYHRCIAAVEVGRIKRLVELFGLVTFDLLQHDA